MLIDLDGFIPNEDWSHGSSWLEIKQPSAAGYTKLRGHQGMPTLATPQSDDISGNKHPRICRNSRDSIDGIPDSDNQIPSYSVLCRYVLTVLKPALNHP